MNSFFRLPSQLRTSISSIPLGRNVINTARQRAYVHDTTQNFSQANAHDNEEDCDRGNLPNHPVPSNKAHPTLRDGRQSNLADMAGVPHEHLPEDVRKHNEDMEHRYDRPYNHIADEGKIENAFEQK